MWRRRPLAALRSSPSLIATSCSWLPTYSLPRSSPSWAKAAATSARFKEHMETRTKNVSCTQPVEDINGVQAVASDTHNRKFRLPATALAYVLKKDPVADRHKYENVEIKRTAPRRSPHLDRDLFEPRTANQSLNCSEVVSTNQTPKWYSTTAERMTTPHADIFMLRWIKSVKQPLRNVEHAWLGSCSDVKHMLAIGFKMPKGKVAWHLCCHYWHKSACLLWPCDFVTVGDQAYCDIRLLWPCDAPSPGSISRVRHMCFISLAQLGVAIERLWRHDAFGDPCHQAFRGWSTRHIP